MANSIRQQVMVAVVSSLSNISEYNGYQTDVEFVSENIKHFSELGTDKFPALFPIDTNEAKEHFTFHGTTAQDMKSTLTVLVTSYLFSRTGVTVQARSDLLRDIEKAMVNATSMTEITSIISITPVSVTTDQGTIENYSVHDQEFAIEYVYNHVDGG